MFGFSRRRTKLGRLKVQLSDPRGTRSPIRNPRAISNCNGEGATSSNTSLKPDGHRSSAAPEFHNCTSGNSEHWMVLSIAGDKPTPRFNHAAAVTGNKMVVVGGESANGLLQDVQVLNFDTFTWTTVSSKLYFSPTRLPLKIPACKGHSLISWGKKVLLIGGKTDPASERVSVWEFDTETECWSLMEVKGDIPAARSGHTVARASSCLILFGGEDSKRRKLNDLHMFDLKSLTWLPLHCTGPRPSPRSNHLATLYDDKILLIFGGASKSRTLNDLYSLDFETMIWSRIKIRDFHPSPRAGCCGVLCGTKWYIAGGGSRKKRHAEMLVFDVLKHEWSVAVACPTSSITTNKGFSLVQLHNKERDFLVAFGGTKKEPSNQVEAVIMKKNELSEDRRLAPTKGAGSSLSKNQSSTGLAMQRSNGAFPGPVDAVVKQNLASVIEQHGSGRRSLSESLIVDPNYASGNVSLRKQFDNEEDSMKVKIAKSSSGNGSPSEVVEQRTIQLDMCMQNNITGGEGKAEYASSVFESESLINRVIKQENGSFPRGSDDIVVLLETDDKSGGQPVHASVFEQYGVKIAALIKKNGNLEGQLAAASAGREAAEMNLSSVLKSRQELEKKVADTEKEMELLKEKLAGIELAQEEANSLSNVVHSDNVRLEHDVAFLKAVLEDTQKELHSTRGVVAGERARARQLQVEVFHLKQRLQSLENRAPTPRKAFHV